MSRPTTYLNLIFLLFSTFFWRILQYIWPTADRQFSFFFLVAILVNCPLFVYKNTNVFLRFLRACWIHEFKVLLKHMPALFPTRKKPDLQFFKSILLQQSRRSQERINFKAEIIFQYIQIWTLTTSVNWTQMATASRNWYSDGINKFQKYQQISSNVISRVNISMAVLVVLLRLLTVISS